MSKRNSDLTRRSLLQAIVGAGAAVGLLRLAPAATYEPTPSVEDHDDPTPAETEGPFFKPSSPVRKSLREGTKGKLLVVEGQVLTTAGHPVAGALLDFWHCDSEGVYDNVGFKLRGHQYTDKDGRYHLETILPGTYPGRTRHIHVKAQAPKGQILTTQLYFPNEPGNAKDGMYQSKLEMKLSQKDETKMGKFDFVLA